MGAGTVGLYLTAATAAYSIYSGERAADQQQEAARDAERLANKNAQLIEKEGERQQQLAKRAADDVEATARAKVAASGFARGGETQSLVLDDIAKQHSDSLEWMREATRSQADITRQGGQYARDAGYGQASSTRAQGYGQALSSISAAGNANDWWQ